MEYIERHPPTDAQLAVLRILALETVSRKMPPTLQEVAARYGCKVGSIHNFVQVLSFKGLTENKGGSHGWRPTRLGWKMVKDWLGDQGVVMVPGECGMTVYQRVDVMG